MWVRGQGWLTEASTCPGHTSSCGQLNWCGGGPIARPLLVAMAGCSAREEEEGRKAVWVCLSCTPRWRFPCKSCAFLLNGAPLNICLLNIGTWIKGQQRGVYWAAFCWEQQLAIFGEQVFKKWYILGIFGDTGQPDHRAGQSRLSDGAQSCGFGSCTALMFAVSKGSSGWAQPYRNCEPEIPDPPLPQPRAHSRKRRKKGAERTATRSHVLLRCLSGAQEELHGWCLLPRELPPVIILKWWLQVSFEPLLANI